MRSTALTLVAVGAVAGCSSTIIVDGPTGGTTGSGASTTTGSGAGGSGPVAHPTVDKIDLLLALDNSSSMADKQQILAAAVPDLIHGLANPRCVDATFKPVSGQPSGSTEPCPSGSHREFQPILDINIGIVDSSLGADGSDQCNEADMTRNNDDHGHLVARGQVPTYQNLGFLAWDPENKRGGITDSMTLVQRLTDMVIATNQVGCGYEHQLESVVRFLVDPNPYASLDKGSGGIAPVTPSGTDQTVLQQRAQFLRPDSLVAVVMLTDENDCSIDITGPQNYAVLNAAPWFRSSSVCATNPDDACCYSCGLGAPSGCSDDPVCGTPKLSAAEDSVNLRCFHQKQRYGMDFLYPVQRYVTALSSPRIDPTRPDLRDVGASTTIDNPLFTDLSGSGIPPRDPGLVFFVGIVGVPSQVISHGPMDAAQGLLSFDQLMQNGFFPAYVGDPDQHVEPTAPIMVEDFHKRGVGPGEPNGGDRSIDTNAPGDLQYACIFDLSTPNPMGGDCKTGTEADNPLCTAGAEPQVKAKAYPGLRELSVLQGLGAQGITASICPTNVTNPQKADYGYRPVVEAFFQAVRPRLAK